MKRFFNNCLFLYFIGFLLCYFIVDHKAVAMKTMDSLPSVNNFILDFARSGQTNFNPPRSYESLQYYKNLQKVFPDSAIITNAIGFCYYHLKDYEKAVRTFKQAIRKDKTQSGFYYNLALTYYQMGRKREAINNFKKFLQVKPDVLINNSLIIDPFIDYAKEGDMVTIRQRYGASQRGHQKSLEMIVKLYQSLNKAPEVLSGSLRGLSMDIAGKEYFLYYAGIASYTLEHYDKALWFFQEYLKIHSTSKEVALFLANTLTQLKAFDSAEIIRKQAKKLPEGSIPEVSINLALYFYYPKYSKIDLLNL